MVPQQQAPMQSALGALGALGNLGNLGQLSAGVMSGLGGGLGGPGTQISPQDQEKVSCSPGSAYFTVPVCPGSGSLLTRPCSLVLSML